MARKTTVKKDKVEDDRGGWRQKDGKDNGEGGKKGDYKVDDGKKDDHKKDEGKDNKEERS
ncbi:hypothetical protein AAF712_012704 [Marasmius tenuissimus]|uniref:Uncharacterized protein n=1 Tax=Marasmius tenuissimus TaxID=585030 RepID=A0ABR2ZH43_9AGAR